MVEEYTDDGSKYEGEFVNGLHHGKGRFTWKNGQYYEGSFYKDYRHGDGSYYWPNGHKFTGKFYLNRREGYGRHEFPDGAIFQGLYSDQWFGPGVLRYPGGAEDVGLWVGDHLIQLCTSVKDSFSLKSFPEYASFLKPTSTTYIPPQVYTRFQPQFHSYSSKNDARTFLKFDFIYPPYMESYSTNGDFLPLPPGRRKELDQQFFGDQWEPDVFQYKGFKRDPLSDLPLQPRMQAHIYKHRSDAH
uniref:MORN repeat-containing protein 5 n=1 Tax=Gouania willdenowi TaxID=441366 RepID=A0A8C5D882_GOUWI